MTELVVVPGNHPKENTVITDEMIAAYKRAYQDVWTAAAPISQGEAVTVERNAVRAGLTAALTSPRAQTDAQRLTDANDILIGTVENGPWVLIKDPALRDLIGRYVADAAYEVADAAGLDEARAVARRLRGEGRLPTAPDIKLPAEHHRPLLALTAEEVEAIRRALMQRPINAPHVSSALDKLAEAQP